MALREDIHEQCRGRWAAILPQVGVGSEFLTGKHGPCPICKGGKDRFRWDNKDGRGSYICNVCGAGSAIDLIMKVNGVSFIEAKDLVLPLIQGSRVESARAHRTGHRDMQRLSRIWMEGTPLNGTDPASIYIARRGINLDSYPSQLRYHPRLAYFHDDKSVTHHPAMLAKFVGADKSWTLHQTFLDRAGSKADVRDCKKLVPGRVPVGGAVRLADFAETMGVAEGVETALSAQQMFDVPVWATLTTGLLINWQPPEGVRCILIFADNDENFAGQAAAYPLAHQLKAKGYHVQVRLPPLEGADWNDVLTSEGGPSHEFIA